MQKYTTVIGLEVHAQMLTNSKIFCGCSATFGADANTQVCPICSGFPGVLPVLNSNLVDMAIKTGLAINAKVNLTSEFSRKNYFYPDLPSGYQISQFDMPIIGLGHLNIDIPDGSGTKGATKIKTIGVTRIHMEVDAGKNLHEGIVGASWVDLNRTGTPLLEIVSEPDMRSSLEAGEYLKKLRATVRYLEVCDGNMEQGSFRCDANVSVNPEGSDTFGTRAELKNLNSIRNVMRAIDYEVERQIDLIESGGKVIQETRLWDPKSNATRSMRGKEEAHDYRYFPEPDLPRLTFNQARVDRVAATLPELPDAKKARFMSDYGLSAYDAGVLISGRRLADYYEAVAAAVAKGKKADPKVAANWVSVELLGLLNKEGKTIAESPISAEALGGMIQRILDNTISGKIAKQVFAEMYKSGKEADAIIEEKGLKQVTDNSVIEPVVDQILADNPKEVE
ncbi:MAG: Asp-tRNA(Asn)/Glu-tRNA(Gln) amidotransferase subunit GatB, partial [Magnetococcales bacterium]|nr:Asp-tRNA(Asn)/Glu-tRNA(Gln) amidotransferase subunit GatB [Magnetococcales bacterium]